MKDVLCNPDLVVILITLFLRAAMRRYVLAKSLASCLFAYPSPSCLEKVAAKEPWRQHHYHNGIFKERAIPLFGLGVPDMAEKP